jgi:transmembrane sensor
MTAPGQVTSLQSHDAISERAASFFARRRCGSWSEADQVELDAWLAQSTSHYVAWLRVQRIGARADRLAALNALEFKQAAARSRSKFRYLPVVLPLLAAASAAVFMVLGIPLVKSIMQPPDRMYSTEVGGRNLLKFADGTVIDLDTNTGVRFRMTNAERTVWLEKGKAWFHVSHNASNPFTVIVDKHSIRDIGTEFVVRRGTDEMEVAVLNGRATLSTDGAQVAMLLPGDDAVTTRASISVTRKEPQELADMLAWRRGMLVFRNTKLVDAVREINRYTANKLVIADPRIADLKFNGEIRNDNVGDFLDIAQSMMKLRVARQGKEILLSHDITEKTKRAANAKREQ